MPAKVVDASALANTCAKKVRRHPDDRATLIRALGCWTRLNVAILPVDIAAVVELASDTKLTAYDASYPWLAERFSYELITLDRRLSAAYRVSPGTP
ncbi:MAG: hypothetical protein EXQ94_00195 [Alphaproteobacteria bacterium]|nr:hypothetical protein [Alphaproteobacteria bacterium]